MASCSGSGPMSKTERVLVKVEYLTTERWGRGAAVSVDEEGRTCYVRCWDAKGIMVSEVSRTSRGGAIGAMLYDLKLAKATAGVEVEDD